MRPLNILLANNTLSLLAGSETWTYTLALQLKQMGHSVFCFAGELGIWSDKLNDQNIKCFKDINVGGISQFSFVLEENIEHKYDVIIANHFHIVEQMRFLFPKTPIISTIHGIIHFQDDGTRAPEHPALNAGVNQFISVSEEVKQKLAIDYGLESVIIRNFFDLKQYKDIKPVNEKPKQFLINTNYASLNDPEVLVIKEVAKKMGARLSAVGINFTQMVDMRRVIEDADVVFGMGRSVLEGVAAGRLGIVHGRWGTGGVVKETSIKDLQFYNFSGRNSRNNLATVDEIIQMIEQFYHPKFIDWGKNYIAQNHNVVLAAEEYIRISRELTGDIINKPVLSGIAPDAKPFKLAHAN